MCTLDVTLSILMCLALKAGTVIIQVFVMIIFFELYQFLLEKKKKTCHIYISRNIQEKKCAIVVVGLPSIECFKAVRKVDTS